MSKARGILYRPEMIRAKLEGIGLRIDKIIHRWYYKRVDEHFRQFRFRRSVILLHQHVRSYEDAYESQKKLALNAAKNADAYLKELQKLRMQQAANPDLLRDVNRMFGTDFPTSDEN